MVNFAMSWTKEDEDKFQAYVTMRNASKYPFNPFGAKRKPPTPAELTAMLPMSLRVSWALDMAQEAATTSQDAPAPDTCEPTALPETLSSSPAPSSQTQEPLLPEDPKD